MKEFLKHKKSKQNKKIGQRGIKNENKEGKMNKDFNSVEYLKKVILKNNKQMEIKLRDYSLLKKKYQELLKERPFLPQHYKKKIHPKIKCEDEKFLK